MSIKVTDKEEKTITFRWSLTFPVMLRRFSVHYVGIIQKHWIRDGDAGEKFDADFYGRKLTSTGKEDMRMDCGYISADPVQVYAVAEAVLRKQGFNSLADQAAQMAKDMAEMDHRNLDITGLDIETYTRLAIERALEPFKPQLESLK